MAGAAPSVGTAGAGTPRGMGAAVVVVPVAVGASTNAADAMSPAGIGRAHFVDARELFHLDPGSSRHARRWHSRWDSTSSINIIATFRRREIRVIQPRRREHGEKHPNASRSGANGSPSVKSGWRAKRFARASARHSTAPVEQRLFQRRSRHDREVHEGLGKSRVGFLAPRYQSQPPKQRVPKRRPRRLNSDRRPPHVPQADSPVSGNRHSANRAQVGPNGDRLAAEGIKSAGIEIGRGEVRIPCGCEAPGAIDRNFRP